VKKSILGGFLLLLAAVSQAFPAPASSASGFDKRFEIAKARNEGFFASISVRPQAVFGDFRSDLTLWHFDKAFYVPSFRHGIGADYGIGLGHKNAYGSWEVRYSLALPKAAVGGTIETVQFHELEISGRSFFFPGRAFQPYGLLGIDLPLVVVPEGSSYLGEKLNAVYAGAGLHAGAGVTWDFSPDSFLDIGIIYRYVIFYYAYGEGKGRDINHLRTTQDGDQFGRLLRSSSLALTASLGFLF
jgi:hypothetical protein